MRKTKKRMRYMRMKDEKTVKNEQKKRKGIRKKRKRIRRKGRKG